MTMVVVRRTGLIAAGVDPIEGCFLPSRLHLPPHRVCPLLTLRWGAVVSVLSAVFLTLSPLPCACDKHALWADSWGGSTPSPAIASTAAHRPRPTRLHAADGHSRRTFRAYSALCAQDQTSSRAYDDRGDVSDDMGANLASASIVSNGA
ncbi:hypothetical protein BDZ89DRAFT_1144796 [Hymenopellis radicata]|nr:hypothetical protein BDZ89DRAFT_1144796 [Hymenopellis radicata]